MSHYEYKVVPAPRRAKRVRGVKGAEELFALTLTDAINEVARQCWEYVRAEHLSAEAPGGWFRGGTSGEQAVLVFRRDREALGPRLIVALGSTAVASLLGNDAKVMRDRGRVLESSYGPCLVTVHPSSLLRIEEEDDRVAAFGLLVGDLQKGVQFLGRTAA